MSKKQPTRYGNTGMGNHKHAVSGYSPQNRSVNIQKTRETNKKLEEEGKAREKRRRHGLVDNIRDLFR